MDICVGDLEQKLMNKLFQENEIWEMIRWIESNFSKQ